MNEPGQPWTMMQRQRIRPLRAPMNEVDVEAVDVRLELLESIEASFLLAPVKLVAPIRQELFQIREVGPVVPARAFDLIRESRPPQTILQVGEHGVRHLNLEGSQTPAIGGLARNTAGGVQAEAADTGCHESQQ